MPFSLIRAANLPLSLRTHLKPVSLLDDGTSSSPSAAAAAAAVMGCGPSPLASTACAATSSICTIAAAGAMHWQGALLPCPDDVWLLLLTLRLREPLTSSGVHTPS